MTARIDAIGTWTHAVRLENVELPESDVAILHGPNGWGKTSLFRAVENVAAAFSGTLRPLPFDAFDAGSVRFSDGKTALFMRFFGHVRIGISYPNETWCSRCWSTSLGEPHECSCLRMLVVTYDSTTYSRLTQTIRNDEFLEPDAYREAWWERAQDMWRDEAASWRIELTDYRKNYSAWQTRTTEIYDGYRTETEPNGPQFKSQKWHEDFVNNFRTARNTAAHDVARMQSSSNFLDGFSGELIAIPFVSIETSGTPFELVDRLEKFPHSVPPPDRPFDSRLGWGENLQENAAARPFLDVGRRMSVTFSRVDRVQLRCAKPIEVDLRLTSGSRDARRSTLQPRPGSYEACQVLISDHIKQAASVLQHSVGIELLANAQGLLHKDNPDRSAEARSASRDLGSAVELAQSINRNYEKMAQFGLVTAPNELKLDPNLDDEAAALILQVLTRDRDRLELLMPEYRRLDFFRQFMSRGLRSRELTFTVGRDFGFRIEDKYGRLVPPWELSSGNQHRLSMAISALFETKPGRVLLIDEPELSLDVSWQRALVTDLEQMARIAACQILLSTHSPVLATGHVALLVPQLDVGNSDEVGPS